MSNFDRREFLKKSACVGAAAMFAGPLGRTCVLAADRPGSRIAYGLVTYQWGAKWDLPTLIDKCEKAGVLGVELRTTHAHGVEPTLNALQRKEVKKRFDDSPVTFLGPGSDERFDNPNPEVLAKAIDATKAFVRLSHDVGGSGVKVKPNSFHKNVPHEKTIEQIGKSLNVVGKFAADYGQQIRLEVHGQCAPLPTFKKIMDIADNPNVAVCWNCNPQDLQGEGFLHNFNLVKDRLGATMHVHVVSGRYPYKELAEQLVKMDYNGWLLLEGHSVPKDKVQGLIAERKKWKKLIADAQAANS